MSLASLPFTYFALDVPKRIINSGIEGQDVPDAILGYEITQVEYLMGLCVLFLVLVVINGGFKYIINVYKGVLGERLLRRLRYDLYIRVMRFPLPHFKRLSQGEVISMVTAETERLGDFIGDAVSEPAVQGGILLTYLFFIFNQDPFLGGAAVALYPVQMYVVPKLQRRVNELSKQRVRTLRQVADRVGEGVSGIAEIHAHGTSRFERADISAKLGRIYDIRFDIYKRKYFIKFLNNFIASITPFFFYSVGGYFVIRGELSLGALVAVLAAYKDLNPPWKALLKYYQVKEDMRVRYEQIVEQFQPVGMLDEKLIDIAAEDQEPLTGDLACSRVTFSEDGVVKTLEGVSCAIGEHEHVAIVGTAGSGKEDLPRVLARLVLPTAGQVRMGDRNLAEVPEAVISRTLTYIGQGAFVFSGTVRHNLAYGLKREPRIEQAYHGESLEEWKHFQKEAIHAGNSTDNINADWIDYDAAHATTEAELEKRMLNVLAMVNMRDDIYHLGLRNRIDPKGRPEMARQFVEARARLRELIAEQDMSDLIEPFDEELYNDNATVGENLLFGLPTDEKVNVENLSSEPFVDEALKEIGLYDDLVNIGRKTAETMVELFADLPPDHEFFEQFSFISSEELPDYRALLGRVGQSSVAEISVEDQRRLLGVAFKLVPARHRLGVIDEPVKERLLEARRKIAADMPEHFKEKIAFFDSAQYNPAATLQDNILFGKLSHGAAHARERVGELIEQALQELELREEVMQVGLEFEVGIAGGRLSPSQRQRLAIARCLLKNPDTLILNEATSSLDANTEKHLTQAIFECMEGKRVVWALGRAALAETFDRVLLMEGGQIVEEGTFEELKSSSKRLGSLLHSH
jgi:ABC-type multidrug transport system fused ATPase/permease subunit